MNNKKQLVYTITKVIAFFIAFCLIVFLLRNTVHHKEHSSDKCDTTRVTIVDTIPYLYPEPVDSVVLTYKTVTLAKTGGNTELKIRADTQSGNSYLQEKTKIEDDSAEVVIPITQKMYKSDDYTAWVSGYDVQLDSVYVYPKHEYVEYREKQPPKKWHIGVMAGYGYSPHGMQPYIGIGFTYSLFSF